MEKLHHSTIAAQATYGVVVPDVSDLIAELKEKLAEKRQLGDRDIQSLVIETGMKYQAAAKFLNRLTSEGRMMRIRILEEGHWKSVYRPVKK
jgi:hypothetical protein